MLGHVDADAASRPRGARRWSAPPAQAGRSCSRARAVARGPSPRSKARSTSLDGDPLARGRALGEALDRRGRAVLVERRGPQLDDQRAEVRDLLGHALDRRLDRRAQIVLAAPHRRESPTRRPARLCSVSSCSSRAQRRRSCSEASMLCAHPLLLDRLAGRDRGRRAGGEAPSRRSCSRSKPASSPIRSYAASTPTARPRNASGTSSAVSASRSSSSSELLSADARVGEPLGAAASAGRGPSPSPRSASADHGRRRAALPRRRRPRARRPARA